ncbi:hypothetical protein [Streptomyces sp. NPDC051776]|uniref:hypothetical protein n=1 Tax=Streptomyces sp. NPDC051776 TaxID=3155414 RepID=UPI003423182A
MRLHKIATATMLVLAVSGGTAAAGTGTALADTGSTHGKTKAKTRAEGGSSTGEALFQQNTAQSSRQNNNCNNPNTGVDAGDEVTLTNARVTGRCVTTDGSLTAFSHIHNGPAEAEGGSSTASIAQQNTAQRGWQNNNCNNPNDSDITVDSSRVEGHCTDQDHSFSKHILIEGGGARADGGSSTGGNVWQQNIAQEGRQNNNCNSPNDAFLTVEAGGLVEGRCGNKDASFSKHTRIRGGGARAEGGTSTAGLDQQNIAQEGRQNNNCNSLNFSIGTNVTGGQERSRCGNKDRSFSKHTWVKSAGAEATGGAVGSAEQQNNAQEGRQNNTCNNPNRPRIDLVPGRETSRCGNKDASFNKHTRIKSGGARAEGGSASADAPVADHQNVAQEGRQNNTCAHTNLFSPTLTAGGEATSHCGNKDVSISKHTWVKGDGARAEGGSATAGRVVQQNFAQEGLQNNTCANPNSAGLDVTGGRETSRCGNKDASFSKHTLIKGGGARAEGGSATAGLEQQNTAQEGRQNNNCANPNFPSTTLDPGRETSHCGNKDASFSKHTLIKGGGARAEGGSAGEDVIQQNIAQEGRQNNNCNNSNERIGGLTVTGGRFEGRCGNKDASFSKHTWVKGGGARAEGGSATGDVSQQNIAQEGPQNNSCNNRNSDAQLTVTGGRVRTRCGNKDFSFNHKTFIKGGGAHAEGGSTTGGNLNQQNIAQEGRQNNACANPNFPLTDIDLTGSRSNVGCKTVDGSANLHTADIGGGAKAEGGSSTAALFQQNTAQEGRQSNNCANPNNLTITTSNSRTQAKCTAVDRSTNIATEYR